MQELMNVIKVGAAVLLSLVFSHKNKGTPLSVVFAIWYTKALVEIQMV